MKAIKTVITHGGTFHADGVFACAALRIFSEDNEPPIERVLKVPPEVLGDTTVAVVDIGVSTTPPLSILTTTRWVVTSPHSDWCGTTCPTRG